MTDLGNLATRIPDDLIERTQGEDYAAHHVVTQLLLLAVGPFSFERVEIIRGDVLTRNRDRDTPSFSDEHSTVILRNVIVGAVYRLTCTVDGRREVVEQTGDVEHPENWQHDGARLKDAESDALKRCAMRFGLGLHLWAQEHYRLDAWLARRERQAQPSSGPGTAPDDPTTEAPAGADGGTAPAGPDPTTPPPDGPTATLADLEQIAAARGRNLNAFARAIRDAAKAGELPSRFAQVTVAKLDKMLPADLGLFAVWAQGGDVAGAGDDLPDMAADRPAGEQPGSVTR